MSKQNPQASGDLGKSLHTAKLEFVDYALEALGADRHNRHGPWLVTGDHARRLYWIVKREKMRLGKIK